MSTAIFSRGCCGHTFPLVSRLMPSNLPTKKSRPLPLILKKLYLFHVLSVLCLLSRPFFYLVLSHLRPVPGQDFFARLPKLRVVEYTPAPVRVYGQFAVEAGTYTFAWQGDDGKTVEKRARFSFTFRREKPGNPQPWIIVEHHSSSMPNAPKELKSVSYLRLFENTLVCTVGMHFLRLPLCPRCGGGNHVGVRCCVRWLCGLARLFGSGLGEVLAGCGCWGSRPLAVKECFAPPRTESKQPPGQEKHTETCVLIGFRNAYL